MVNRIYKTRELKNSVQHIYTKFFHSIAFFTLGDSAVIIVRFSQQESQFIPWNIF